MDSRQKVLTALAVTISNNFLREAMDSTDSSSDSDNSDDGFDVCMQLQLRGPRQKPTRIVGYIERTVPRLSHQQFKQHFRMTPERFEHLEATLAPALLGVAGSKPPVPLHKQLLASLWLLATSDSYRSVGDRFDIAKSSLSVSFMRVVDALNNVVGDFIRWPRGDRLAAVNREFQRITQLPDVIGAIDGCHIPIKEPSVDSQFYRTYKKRYAVVLQAVCNAQLVFTDCFAGYPGSVGDVRVFRNSDLWIEVRRDILSFFPNQEYIVGDKAYLVLSWCIPPYTDCGNLSDVQRNFKTKLSKVRQVIERAFALLEGRFRRLKYLEMNRVDKIHSVILACTVLHNICLKQLDEDLEDYIREGLDGEVNDHDDVVKLRVANDNEGIVKRNYLATLVQR